MTPVSSLGSSLVYAKRISGTLNFYERTPSGEVNLNARFGMDLSRVRRWTPDALQMSGTVRSTQRFFSGFEYKGQVAQILDSTTGLPVVPEGLSGSRMVYGSVGVPGTIEGETAAVVHDLETGQQTKIRPLKYSNFVASDDNGTFVFQGGGRIELDLQDLYLYKDNQFRGVGPYLYPSMNKSGEMAMVDTASYSGLYYRKGNSNKLLWWEPNQSVGGPTLTYSGTILVQNFRFSASRLWNGSALVSIEDVVEGAAYDRSRYQLLGGIIDRDTDQIYATLMDRQGIEPYRIIRLDPVPEPGTLAALGLGVAAVLRRRRKR